MRARDEKIERNLDIKVRTKRTLRVTMLEHSAVLPKEKLATRMKNIHRMEGKESTKGRTVFYQKWRRSKYNQAGIEKSEMKESKAEEVQENEKEKNIAWKVLKPIVKAKTCNHKQRKNIEGEKRIEILTKGKRKRKQGRT